jgi:catechol 2,3-dioxygenase-like lactoylglutathione lyase family enzyme
VTHIEQVALIVREYDSAIDFFTRVLDFELVCDEPALTTDGRTKRWVVVRPKAAQSGLLLARADSDAQRALIGRQHAERVGFFLRVDDFDAAFTRMRAAGVTFLSPPRDEAYGRVVVFLDCEGNRWDLLGPSPELQ